MHLKRLEAFGFKSFADKVVFDFEPGVTCFVGPNGCGKSNVVDAVKWVLGEQSAKSLRGGEMLDVIFNGSANRKALNFAEITLTFDNASGKLPLAAPEVSVARRLFRSGESEYLINKAQCRLRDVRELFWDTGIGTSSYSIIEQGRIAALLEANSKDRRVLFEEAAGIHKYKERKRIALRKLERVEQNLARLNDLLGEIERNLKSVTRQAEKARKASDISQKLRQTKLDILLHDTFASDAALREITASMNLASERVGKLSEELGLSQVRTVEEQTRMGELDVRLSESQNILSSARSRLERLEAEIEAERRSIEDLTTQALRAREAAKAAGERASAISYERERVEFEFARSQENLNGLESRISSLSKTVSTEQEARQLLSNALESARRHAIDALGRRTQLSDTLVRAEMELGSLEYRVRKSHAQMTKAEDQLRFAQAESEEVRERMRAVQHRRETLETEQGGLRTLQTRTDDELGRLARGSQEMERELEGKRSRLTALEGLRESGEGLSPGVRAVLTQLRAELNLSDAVHGLVADCLGVDPALEHAIEAALGGHVESLVVDMAQAARSFAARLSEHELGRATFISLDDAGYETSATRSNYDAGEASPMAAPGCLGRASDLVTCDERYQPVAEALLGDVLVFDTEQNALAACASGNGKDFGYRRVSLGGEFIERHGIYSGGRNKAQRLGLIGRKNEIARLGVQMDELRLRIQALAERTAFLEKRAQRLGRDQERIGADLTALSHSQTELKSMLLAIEREESRSAEEKNLASQEIHELEAERTAHAERVMEMKQDLENAKRIESESGTVVQARETDVARSEAALSASREQLADIERECATLRERVNALEREAQGLSAQFAERRDENHREEQRGIALEERRDLSVSVVSEKDRTRGELSALIESSSAETFSLQEQKDEARGAFEQARGQEREIATEQEKAREELSSVREREVNLRLRLESKLETARSEFQLDAMAELATRGGPPVFSGIRKTEDAAQVEEGGQPEDEQSGTDADGLGRAIELVRQLEEKLARLGPVNMYALEEMQELEKRFGFLKVQSEDLESARASLRDVTARINRRSRTLFQETFEAVKLHFNEIFRKLFGGGKADLVLEEGEDILEAGIEILARPPGKEISSVTLLSGGEKTMTMIALLFAVFRSRPAPFCILDEVDAPLDEANVDRFNLIVREFMDQSQFVIITHNKKTMSHADVLYGITMPEPGVSKRIAIKFSEIEKHLPMQEIDRAAAAARKASLAQAEAATPVEEVEAKQVEANAEVSQEEAVVSN